MLAWYTQFRRCRRLGVQITLSQVLGMWLRKVRASEVFEAVAIATEAGVEFPIDHAEIAYLSGSRPVDQARAAKVLADRGESLDLEAIMNCDICGFDVVRLAQDGWDMSKVGGAHDGPGDEYMRSVQSD